MKNIVKISLDDEILDLFERTRTDMSMTKSNLVAFLLREHHDQIPSSIKYKEIISEMSEINLYLKSIGLNETWTPEEKKRIFERVDDLEQLIKKRLK